VKRLLVVLPSLVFVFFLPGCAPQGAMAKHRIHHTFLEAPEARAPKKFILLPADITVNELSAGGVTEKVEEWSIKATQNVEKSIRAHIAAKRGVQLVELPPLSGNERENVEQYRALYDQVAYAAFTYGRGWPHKNERFDYGVGNGLKFLREKTGADAAIFCIGVDSKSTGGRKAAFIFAAAFGVAIPMGTSFLNIGIVDLATGDILWYSYDVSQTMNLDEPIDVDRLVANVLENYPGLEAFQPQKAAAK
jgi:hypothetical protein